MGDRAFSAGGRRGVCWKRPPTLTDLHQFRTQARNWEAFAQADPLFGVLSDPRKVGGRWDTAEFFETGTAHVNNLFRILRELDVDVPTGSCLDFGCGPGRLTVPLSRAFERTVGVDVSPSMIERATELLPSGARCTFVLNRKPDLQLFEDAAFDAVHTCLVLQHIPTDVTRRYIREFFRVVRPGGLVLFQLPAVRLSEDEITAKHALPADAFGAQFAIVDPPSSVMAYASVPLRVRITNRSAVRWRHDLVPTRRLCLGNHWLHADGSTALRDDGRTPLPTTIEPGETLEVTLTATAPAEPGAYVVEVDLVQERVCWFAEKGATTARAPITVTAATIVPPPPEPPPAAPPLTLWQRVRKLLGRGAPTFEMHVIPRDEVEELIRSSGGVLLHAVDDNAAGERWISYTYVCRRN